MTSFVITNAGTTQITINGRVLDCGVCCGYETPAEITGTGEFYISCNSNPDISGAVYADGLLVEPAIKADPVSVTLSDNFSRIAVVEQDTRFPYEGNFPLLRTVRVE